MGYLSLGFTGLADKDVTSFREQSENAGTTDRAPRNSAHDPDGTTVESSSSEPSNQTGRGTSQQHTVASEPVNDQPSLPVNGQPSLEVLDGDDEEVGSSSNRRSGLGLDRHETDLASPVRTPTEPPVVARLMVEIRSDGSHTIARGAVEDISTGQHVAIEASGRSPAQLAVALARSLASAPFLNRRKALAAKTPSKRNRPRSRIVRVLDQVEKLRQLRRKK